MKLSARLAGALLAAAGFGAVTLPAQAAPVFFNHPDCGTSCVVDMQYYGGPVMTGSTDIFIIWYGNWGADTSQTILPSFFGSLTGSDYMNIALLYDNGAGTKVSNTINFGGAINVPASATYGITSVSDANIAKLVTDAQGSAALPTESNAIYFVYTAPGIRQEEDTVACGWHSNTGSTKYSWVSPDPGCDFLGGVTGNVYADALTETSSHEMFEALTDPNVGDALFLGPPLGWYDATYGENGDMCVLSNFAADLNGKSFDVQSIWVNDKSNRQGGFCASGNTTASTSVPEPASGGLVLAALGLLALRRRRQ